MSEKLAAKHKNSLVAKKNKLLPESESKNCWSNSRSYRLAIFCILTCCIFVTYWIILTPLLLNVFVEHHSENTDRSSAWLFVLYWLIAFVVWLFIMLCLVLIWRCSNTKHYDNEKLQSYGTNCSSISESLISKKFDRSKIAKLQDIKKDGSLNDPTIFYDKPNTNISDEVRRNKMKKHKDLPPLVIHRRNSGNGIERVGTVNVEGIDDESNEDKVELKSGDDHWKTGRESMKEYLKLVTVTPQDELDTKTPKGPLSPRELFFIDLIKEAEKAEQSKGKIPEGREGKQFFPNDFCPTKKDGKNVSNEEERSEIPVTNKEPEATYFIANIESPKSEKAEVYLEIDPDPGTLKEWSMDLSNEKPVLMLQGSSKDEENNSTNEKIVLFEV